MVLRHQMVLSSQALSSPVSNSQVSNSPAFSNR